MTAAFLYVVLRPSDGARKVGLSINPAIRLYGISNEQRQRCILEHMAECPAEHIDAAEKHAHALLWEARIEGEWFTVEMETARAAIDAAIATMAAGEQPQAPPRKGKPERFEMRISSEVTHALDFLRRQEPDVPSRAEMVRRMVDRKHAEVFGPDA